jgi:hypothetical protein
MRSLFVTAAVAAFATAAGAQAPPGGGQNAFQPPAIGGPPGGPGGHPPPGMMMGPMMGGAMMPHHPPPPKGTHFRFAKGDNTIDVQCAEDEPTKACVDATVTLLDKLNSMKEGPSGEGSSPPSSH